MVLDEESLSCKFCFEILQDPRVLTCGHSMCHRCVMTNINFKRLKLKEPFLQASPPPSSSSSSSNDKTTKIAKLYGTGSDQSNESNKDKICFNCPTCNTQLKIAQAEDVPNVFPINYDLKNTVENYLKKEKGQMCANCDDRVVQVECEDCNNSYCEECFNTVHSLKVFASHRRAPLGTIVTVGKCKKHKKDLDLVCKDCRVVVCHLCSLASNHKGHSCVPIDEHMEESKAGMSKKIELIGGDIDNLMKALKQISCLQHQLNTSQEEFEVAVS